MIRLDTVIECRDNSHPHQSQHLNLEPEMNLQNHMTHDVTALAPALGIKPRMRANAQDRIVSGSMVTG